MRFRFSLATLLVLLAVLPPVLALVWHYLLPLYDFVENSLTSTRSIQLGFLAAALGVIVWACRTERR